MPDKRVLMTLEDIGLTYDENEKGEGTAALVDVNLTIYEGDFICVLGPSGCGKSTLLNIMAGLLPATQGTILMEGVPVEGVDWKRAVVFQQPTLYPWLNVSKNIAFGPEVRGIDKQEIERRVNTILDKVGLTDFANVKPFELSGGMRQRVSLARALVNDPHMILLDEPFGALDAFTRVTMQDLIRMIWKEMGTTVFLITHDVDEALMLGTRVMAMSPRPGRIIREYEVDFTRQVADSEEDVRYSDEYVTLRKDLLAAVGHGRKE